MQTHEKLKVMRQCKNWTQEKFAEKLGWAVNSYAKIERGEANIKLDKLERIAEILGVDIQELISSDEKTVINFAENCAHGNLNNLAHCTILLTEAQCVHELEKAHLILEQKDQEINFLRREIERLEEMVGLLKQLLTP